MQKEVFEDRIKTKRWYAPSDEADQWWHSSSCDTFIGIGTEMSESGMPYFVILRCLGRLYVAVSGEYGD